MIIARFLRWWGEQLAQLLPSRLREGRERSRIALLVDETAGGIELRLRQRGRTRELGSVEEAAKALPGSVRRDLARVIVRPAADGILVREIELPAAAAAAPREALELNMDTYTPFSAERVYFGFSVLPRRTPRGNLRVRLAVTPRERLEPALAPLASLRLEASGDLEPGDTPGTVGLVFEQARRSHKGGTLATAALVTINLSLAVLLVAVPWQRQSAELQRLETSVASAREAAEEVNRMEQQLAAQRARTRFLAEEARTGPSMTLLLEELSRWLPDDSWLIGLQANRESVRLQGFSNRASLLIAALQESSMLKGARFASPIVNDPATGTERFDIRAGVAQRDSEGATAPQAVAESGGSN